MTNDIAISSISLKDIDNDTIQSFGGITVANVSADDIVTAYPGWAFFDQTSLGEKVLCVARIDGNPFSVSATNAIDGAYTPPTDDYMRLFGPRHRRRPKNK